MNIKAVGRTQRRLALVGALSLAFSAACKNKPKKDESQPSAGAPASAGSASKRLPDPACNTAAVHKTGAISWIEDDYPLAVRCAAAQGLPLVVDMWAPWCHTCLSMKNYVFPDPSFAELSSRFVWVALDTDRPANTAAVAKLPPAAWPTFYVVAPSTEQVTARYVGSASVKQFREFLAQGERGVHSGGVADEKTAEGQLVLGDRAAMAKDHVTAATRYGAALDLAAPGWARFDDTMAALASSLLKADSDKPPAERLPHLSACVALANGTGTRDPKALSMSSSRADFWITVLSCADGVQAATAKSGAGPDTAPVTTEVTSARTAAEQGLRTLIAAPQSTLSVDDKSDAMMNLREVLTALGRPADAKAIAEQQLSLLTTAFAQAPSAHAAMTFGWPLAELYNFLGRQLELVPVLEKLHADLPEEYDPPYRLAWLYKQLKDYPKAIQWAETAERKAYGARRVRMLNMLASLHDSAGARVKQIAELKRLMQAIKELPTPHDFEALLSETAVTVQRLEDTAGQSDTKSAE